MSRRDWSRASGEERHEEAAHVGFAYRRSLRAGTLHLSVSEPLRDILRYWTKSASRVEQAPTLLGNERWENILPGSLSYLESVERVASLRRASLIDCEFEELEPATEDLDAAVAIAEAEMSSAIRMLDASNEQLQKITERAEALRDLLVAPL